MGQHEKKAYLQHIKPRYKKASKAGKQRILDEFCAVCGYHRKYAIRALNTAGKGGNHPGLHDGQCQRGQRNVQQP